MAAAYAALVSLIHTIKQIQHHPRPPIAIEKEQVESLTRKVTFLQEFLEGYSSHFGYTKEADRVENRIADAAHAAEDVIESHIVHQILAGSTSCGKRIGSINFYQDLQKVIEDMDSIKKEVMKIKEELGVQHQLHSSSSISAAGSLRSASTGQSNIMVGFDDILLEIMDKLIGGQLDRQILPVVGMGGIGKTTLARNIYQDQVVVQHFDILAWVTISQEYRTRDVLLGLLQGGEGNLSHMTNDELGDKVHKRLSGRRYLIIMDDIWNIEVWDQLKFFFPNNNGSRIMLTTRLSQLGFQLSGSHYFQMNFLNEDESWELLCRNVFGKEGCPHGLEETGKMIARNCKGLPLSIIVIGGFLAKYERTQECWKNTLENLNSIVNLEDNQRCLRILYMSYNNLPVHLKPCFLYMGVFPEDKNIRVSKLVKIWSAEGFLKTIGGKSSEDVAKEYLEELVDRNLILVENCNYYGKPKLCKIHDLQRDLCLREARKQKFFCTQGEQNPNIPQDKNIKQRICLWKEWVPQVDPLEYWSIACSLIWEWEWEYSERDLRPFGSRLIRVLYSTKHKHICSTEYLETIFQHVNLRYLDLRPLCRIPSSVYLLWNLQTLIVDSACDIIAPLEIWKMPQLRHIKYSSFELPDPPADDIVVLENLQTLSLIVNFRCSEEVVKWIPNIKKLKLFYEKCSKECSYYCFHNFGNLHNLESLWLCFSCIVDTENIRSHMVQLIFLHYLKKLTLYNTYLNWGDMTTKIGSLPLLQVLKLLSGSLIGPEWETVEGQFCGLRFLVINIHELQSWIAENTHFPRLEHLHLQGLKKVEGDPFEYWRHTNASVNSTAKL